ncbi:Uncharacterised protein [Yersinia frederiksenii]|nr:Uncharacterised protein [Yersinia frederiksenii]
MRGLTNKFLMMKDSKFLLILNALGDPTLTMHLRFGITKSPNHFFLSAKIFSIGPPASTE